MLVYRLAHPKYAQDISGYGALLVAGRWNFKGHRVLYTAENSSLALLEYLAHTEGVTRKLPYQLITIEVPDHSMEKLSIPELEDDWKNNLMYTRELGTNWIDGRSSLIFKIPSVLNEDNYNYLVNPEHGEFNKVKIINSKEITFDKRLW